MAIVGGGYAGLSCAIELADSGLEACVLEAAELGSGASTRSGGAVSGGVNIGKSFTGKVISRAPEVDQEHPRLRQRCVQPDRKPDRSARGIDCHWEKTGRFVGAWTPKDYQYQESRVATLNADAASGSYMVPKERQREEMASDYYYGGMVVERSAKLHPALYYKGLLDAARRRPIAICAKAAVKTIKPVRRRLADRDVARQHRSPRRGHRHQWLHRRCDAGTDAAAGAAGEPHHRHRGTARQTWRAR